MKSLSDNLPSTNALSALAKKPLTNSVATPMDGRKTSQLLALLTQSFEIFNVYGKEPEAVKSILGGFSVILAPYEIGHITAAFTRWMQISSTMPTPSDILKLTIESKSYSNIKQTGKPKWVQVIRDYKTDKILEERYENHLSPDHVDLRHGRGKTRTAMRREPPFEHGGDERS